MLDLCATADDDPEFLFLASRLIGGAAVANGFTRIVIAQVDHWFGPRWLGFCGKLLGRAGVRSRRLTGALTPPPFHPRRVKSARAYGLTDSGVFERGHEVDWLHRFQPSEANIYRTLARGWAYAWYSGGTVSVDKGVVMMYFMHRKWSTAWYVGFEVVPHWHVSASRAIAPRRVDKFLNWQVREPSQPRKL